MPHSATRQPASSGRRHHPGGAFTAAVTVAAIVCVLATSASARATEPPHEYRVKAAFIYHFLHFTDWPGDVFAAEDAPIVVGVVGGDAFQGALDQALHDKTVRSRPIVLRHFDAPGDVRDCHLLFVSPASDQHVGNVLRRVRGAPVLTVSDGGGDFTRSGGVLRLLVEEDKVRFEVNLTAAERQKLRMSAKLLKLARLYEEPSS